MYFGSFAKPFTVLAAAAALSVALAARPLTAQLMEEQTSPRAWRDGAQQGGPMQALFMSSGSACSAHSRRRTWMPMANPWWCRPAMPTSVRAVAPAIQVRWNAAPNVRTVPCDDGYGGPMAHGGGGHGQFTGPYPMGAGGTDPPVGYDLMDDVGMEGFLVDQRGPHYFDARARSRAHDAGRNLQDRDIAFTSLNVTDDNIVLSSWSARLRLRNGLPRHWPVRHLPAVGVRIRLHGNLRLGGSAPRSPIRTRSIPMHRQPVLAVFRVRHESRHGDRSSSARCPKPSGRSRIAFRSIPILQTAEMSYRRYWVGFIPRVSGTLLAGFRYTKLKEDFHVQHER